MAECKKCIHNAVCKTAESCDGYVSGCEHFKEKKQVRIDVREKLVELIDDATVENIACVRDGNPVLGYFTRLIKDGCASLLADNLIANGVIVLPCNVGDTVWYNKAELQETCPAKVIGIHINFYTPSIPFWVTIQYQSKWVGRQEEKMASDVFKLLCHYDRWEAEAALPQPPKGE